MRIKELILSAILMITAVLQVQAQELPKEIKEYLESQKIVPVIRPDGVVMYGDSIMYLPVFPAYYAPVKELHIIKTYPAGQTLLSMPDAAVFNNNFGLIKIVKNSEGKYVLNDLGRYPAEIRTGTLPQDLMAPSGLVFPESLAGILGDVYIPVSGSAKSGSFVSGRKAPLPTGKIPAETKRSPIPDKLQNKLFYVNDFRTPYLKVFSSSIPEPLYSLKTSGVIKDFKPAMGGRYILSAPRGAKVIDVIDTAREYIVKHIDLTAEPSEIAVDDKRERAYISSTKEEALFAVDLKTMRMTEKIQLTGAPKHLAVSPDGSKIAYMDAKTSNILILELDNDYENKLITNYPNTSKIILDNKVLYLIARTEPKLRAVTFDLTLENGVMPTKKDLWNKEITKKDDERAENAAVSADVLTGFNLDDYDEDRALQVYAVSIKDIPAGGKPVDMQKFNDNIFVLCAAENAVYKYNISSGAASSVKLPIEGFSNAAVPVPDSSLAVITNMAEYKYTVYDMEKGKADAVFPINNYANSMIILERKK